MGNPSPITPTPIISQGKNALAILGRWLGRFLMPWRVLAVSLLAITLLSGCVNYDVGLNFSHANQGAIVQHIKLGQRFTLLSSQSAEEWLANLERKTHELGGKVNRLPGQEVIITIPFYSGPDLVDRFNQFFALSPESGEQGALDLPALNPKLALHQNNWLLAVRNRLSYDIDLQALGVVSADGDQLVNASNLMTLQLGLSTPWAVQNIDAAMQVDRVELLQGGRSLLWVLKPGQENHLEATFWVPNILGIGTVVIILTMVVGNLLRYRLMRPPVPLPTAPFS